MKTLIYLAIALGGLCAGIAIGKIGSPNLKTHRVGIYKGGVSEKERIGIFDSDHSGIAEANCKSFINDDPVRNASLICVEMSR